VSLVCDRRRDQEDGGRLYNGDVPGKGTQVGVRLFGSGPQQRKYVQYTRLTVRKITDAVKQLSIRVHRRGRCDHVSPLTPRTIQL
jgi:hypothetical protein